MSLGTGSKLNNVLARSVVDAPLSFTPGARSGSDFTIITSDGTLSVHRSILENSSLVFQDMFAMPQPQPGSSRDGQITAAKNEVVLTENSWTMGTLLSSIYPVSYQLPTTMALGKLFNLLVAAHKYEIEYAIEQIENALLSRATRNAKEALQIYAIGSALGNEKLVKQASKSCLRCAPIDLFEMEDDPILAIIDKIANPNFEEENYLSLSYLLRRMSGWDYHRLLRLYRKRMREAKKILSQCFDGTIVPSTFTFRSLSSGGHYCGNHSGNGSIGQIYKEYAMAELEKSGPTSDIIFSHSFLISCLQSNHSKKNCGECCKALLLDNSSVLTELKRRIDALPDSI